MDDPDDAEDVKKIGGSITSYQADPQTASSSSTPQPVQDEANKGKNNGKAVDMGLPTPEPDSDYEYQSAGDESEILDEAPVPSGDAMSQYTTAVLADTVTKQAATSALPVSPAVLSRLQRVRHEPGQYKTLNTGRSLYVGPCLTALNAEVIATRGPSVPKNYRQARNDPSFLIKWLPAMKQQYDSLVGMKAWDLVELPKESQVLPGKWVYTEKSTTDGKVIAKARWVVCGNFEPESWGAAETYAAVVNASTIKVFLAIAATQNLEIRQYDFDTAFLNASIPDGVIAYVEQPQGFESGTSVCLLRRALYGLRHSPLYWFNSLKPVMTAMGFTSFDSDLCFYKHAGTGALVVLYVDDLLIAAPTMATIAKIATDLAKKFNLKDLGEAARFLGFSIHRDRPAHRIYLSQSEYAKKMLAKFDYEGLNGVNTPWPNNFGLPKKWPACAPAAQKDYLSQTGSVNYYAVGTRPDITYTVGRLCEANDGPSEEHFVLLKHLFRYITKTIHLCLTFGGRLPINNLQLHAFADASFADDLVTRYSTGGHVVFLAGGPVIWKAKKQSIMTLSTTEAEFINLTPAGLALEWIARILMECGAAQPTPLILFTDSMNARTVALNPLKGARCRHIDIRYKWMIDRLKASAFDLRHFKADEMAADGFTKPLGKLKHSQFVKMMNLVDCHTR